MERMPDMDTPMRGEDAGMDADEAEPARPARKPAARKATARKAPAKKAPAKKKQASKARGRTKAVAPAQGGRAKASGKASRTKGTRKVTAKGRTARPKTGAKRRAGRTR